MFEDGIDSMSDDECEETAPAAIHLHERREHVAPQRIVSRRKRHRRLPPQLLEQRRSDPRRFVDPTPNEVDAPPVLGAAGLMCEGRCGMKSCIGSLPTHAASNLHES